MPSVYFFCRDNPNAYQDDVVSLADGLRQKGISVYGNCNYWKTSPDADQWLVPHDPDVQPHDCDIVVVSRKWPQWTDLDFSTHLQPLPADLFRRDRAYRTVYLDGEDSYPTASWQDEYRAFDLILRSKFNRRCLNHSNHRPWALGINHRYTDCLAQLPAWADRDPVLLVNFNATHPYVHSARFLTTPLIQQAAAGLIEINPKVDPLQTPPADPWDRLMWEQTQHRHSRDYYARLAQSQFVAAFCGEIIPPTPSFPRYLAGGRRAKLSRQFHTALSHLDRRAARLIQWDSWRFWESLVAGCLVIHLDLDYYGVDLPVMPVNGEHYLGLRLDNFRPTFERMQAEPHWTEQIARQGREWALTHYSPTAVATRFLDLLT